MKRTVLPLFLCPFFACQSQQDDSGGASEIKASHVASKALFDEIVEMDSLLFTVAFNKCDFDLWLSIMDKNLEFYDDRSGLNTDFDVEIESFKNRCSKSFKVTRKLVSTEVYPLNNYGAIQLGVHDFYIDGKRDETAKFIHLWQRKDNKWMVSRVVSYEHSAVE